MGEENKGKRGFINICDLYSKSIADLQEDQIDCGVCNGSLTKLTIDGDEPTNFGVLLTETLGDIYEREPIELAVMCQDCMVHVDYSVMWVK